jgi:methionyl-tRNA formyltransferase
MDSAAIKALINACNPWNKGAGTIFNDQVIGITEAEIIEAEEVTAAPPGTIIACNKEDGLIVKTRDGKQLRVNIYYTHQGFFSGYRMQAIGVKAGAAFR